jgi:carbonic anhydrase
MKWTAATALAAIALMAAGAHGQEHKKPAAAVTADSVIGELKAGNDHHVNKKYRHPNQSAARQRELATGQHPHAAILACADSRVPPEIVFDQGLGDIFDVRVAGNVATDSETASLEYAAEHLDVPLIVVLGHQKCGAVSATAEARENPPGHLPTLVNLIRPAVQTARSQPGDTIANAVRINVENTVRQLRTSKPILEGFCAKGQLRVVGAVYALDTGRVTWLPETK